jgi:hypothetical membrane protein
MMTRIAMPLFALIVLAGPIYALKDYSVISNVISELGAQNTQNNYVMISGFLILGTAMIMDFLNKKSYPMVPFALFGLFMATAAIFPHKPIDANIQFNSTFHSLHSASATLAGISITAGFVWQGLLAEHKTAKILCFYLALVCFAFPLLMLAQPGIQGIIQRLMYLQILAWVWVMYPEKILANKKHRGTY